MRYFGLIIAVLLSALTASADKTEYKYYIGLLTPYDFEKDGIYYSFGVDVPTGGEDWSSEPMVSVAIGVKDVNVDDFPNIKHEYYSGDVVVPSHVTYEGVTYKVRNVNWHAFAYCDQLRSVILPETVEVIGFGAFAYCPNLTSVKLSSCLKYISQYAFYNCGSLVDMPMPKGVWYIDVYAFLGCDKYPFEISENLLSVDDWGANMEFNYSEGIVLPSTVETVHNFPNVRRLAFGNNISMDEEGKYPWIIGTNNEIIFPEIMVELVLPKAKFNLSAKLRCNKNLERLILPEVEAINVWSIGGIAWEDNPGEFVSMSTVPPVIEGTFRADNDDCYDATLVVPAGSEEAYKNAPVWCEFKTVRGDANIHRYLPGDTGAVPAIEQSATAEEEVRYFDMMGRPVAAPVPGRLYITSDGRKVVIR